MLVEMESYDILYADASKMNALDMATWKQTLKLAVKAAIIRLEVPLQRRMWKGYPDTFESIMLDVGLRLNVTAQGGKRYNLDRRMTLAMRKA